MKRSILYSTAIVLAVGISMAQSIQGKYADYPIVLANSDSTVVAKAGETTYVQLSQLPGYWAISEDTMDKLAPVKGFTGVIDLSVPTIFSREHPGLFWAEDEGTPFGWVVTVPRTESIQVLTKPSLGEHQMILANNKGTPRTEVGATTRIVNTYGIYIPADVVKGTYSFVVKVHYEDTHTAFTFPMNVVVE